MLGFLFAFSYSMGHEKGHCNLAKAASTCLLQELFNHIYKSFKQTGIKAEFQI